MTVTLRPIVADDRAWLGTWLPTLAKAVGYDDTELIDRARTERALHVRAIVREGEPVGVLAYRITTPKRGVAVFEIVGTPPEHARRGAGMVAAARAEEEMRAGGVRTVYAPASEIHGISMYFWIRLGYAPVQRGEWPCEREGVAWLRRSLV